MGQLVMPCVQMLVGQHQPKTTKIIVHSALTHRVGGCENKVRIVVTVRIRDRPATGCLRNTFATFVWPFRTCQEVPRVECRSVESVGWGGHKSATHRDKGFHPSGICMQ